MKKLILVACAIAIAGCTSEEQKKADAIKPEVAAKSKDPESTKFTQLKVRMATLCGEANSKNSYGAYAGAERFKGAPGAITLRSDVEKVEAALAGTKAGEGLHLASDFDRDWQQCQAEGAAVS